MPINTEYDPEADALYIRVGDSAVVRTVEADHAQNLDFGENDELVGIELFAPAQSLRRLATTAERFGFEHRLGEIQQAIARGLPASTTYFSYLLQPMKLTTSGVMLGDEPIVFSSSLGDRSVDLDATSDLEPA